MQDRLIVGLAVLLLTSSCGSGQIGSGSEPRCGDGVVDEDEQCDDANLQDGDGCTALCELEEPDDFFGFVCFEVFEAVELAPSAMVATVDGGVLVGGKITTNERDSHGWIGAFDSEGALRWTLGLEDGHDVHALRVRGDGFIALDRGPDIFTIREFDGGGNSTGETPLPGDAVPRAMLDTDAGLLLAGGIASDTSESDMWLGRLRADGSVETLATQDYAGLSDQTIAIEQSGEVVTTLSSVGVVNHTVDDVIHATVRGTLLVEHDLQGVEIRQTLLNDDEQIVSWVPRDLAVASDGTWIIAGQQKDLDALASPHYAWGAGLRDGEVVWTQQVESPTPPPGELPGANFSAVAAAGEVVFAGRMTAPEGSSRLLTRARSSDGVIVRQDIELIVDDYRFIDLASTFGNIAWFAGRSELENAETQWLCKTNI